MKEKLKDYSRDISNDLFELNKSLYEEPEIGDVEFKSCEKTAVLLEKYGFSVEREYLNIKTAFKAIYDSKKPGKTVSYLCEYDALPEIGHGCGHNMIASMSSGAAILLKSVIDEIGGKIIVFGTPAEETNGAKVTFAENGCFDEVDVAMMVHPSATTRSSGTSMAIYPIEFIYTGKTSHAAACPEKGINALNSVIQLFNGIDALRQHVTPDVRMHGIISEGGVAANIVPDRAVARFYFRASKKETLEELLVKVKEIAKGAALMTGATLEMNKYEYAYDDLVTNENLSNCFDENLRSLGITDFAPTESNGSSDIGNVSQKTSAVHPYVSISDENIISHSIEFANATQTDLAKERLLISALALAYTGLDVLLNKVEV